MQLTITIILEVTRLAGILWKFFRTCFAKTGLENVRGPEPESFITGDINRLLHRHRGLSFHDELAETYGLVARLHGPFSSSMLYLADPTALRYIGAKEGVAFNYPKWVLATENIILGPGLLSVGGAQHRKQRKMLSAVFSDNNMKKMTPLFYGIVHKLQAAISDTLRAGSHEVDLMHWIGRSSLECIAQGGMGHSFDSMSPGSQDNTVVGEAIKNLTPVSFQLNLWRLYAHYLEKLGPPKLRRFLADMAVMLVPDPNLSKMRDIINTLDATSQQILQEREIWLKQGDQVTEENVMSILLRANTHSKEEDRLTEPELLAQMSTMIFAGTDTTSNALARTLHELAAHPDAQDRLRNELIVARDHPNQDIPFEKLRALPLLDAVCKETLRIYSPFNVIPRVALTDVIIPLGRPIRGVDGRLIHELAVPRGTSLVTNLQACNRDKSIWGHDAHTWRPDRWLTPLPDTITKAQIPGILPNLMTFGSGGRACIGFRFAFIEMKVVLAVLLSSFRFSLTEREIVWNLSAISYPTMGYDSIDPSMVLRVDHIG